MIENGTTVCERGEVCDGDLRAEGLAIRLRALQAGTDEGCLARFECQRAAGGEKRLSRVPSPLHQSGGSVRAVWQQQMTHFVRRDVTEQLGYFKV